MSKVINTNIHNQGASGTWVPDKIDFKIKQPKNCITK